MVQPFFQVALEADIFGRMNKTDNLIIVDNRGARNRKGAPDITMGDFLQMGFSFAANLLNKAHQAGRIGTGKQLVAFLPLNTRTVDGKQLQGGTVALDDGQVGIQNKNGINDSVKSVPPLIERALKGQMRSSRLCKRV